MGETDTSAPTPVAMDRRALLQRAAALGISASALPAFLAACSSDGGGGGTGASVGLDIAKPIGLSAEGTPRRGGTLRVGWQYQPVTQMDPQMPTQGSIGDLDALLLVHDQLMNIKPGTLDVEPSLAEDYERSADGLQWTFRLRDAEFSDGSPITAQDARFSLERYANEKINSQYAFLAEPIERVEVLDPKTVRITLSQPTGLLLDSLAHAATSIVPQKAVESMGRAFGQRPIGAGPFKFESKVPGQRIMFVRNDNYRKQGQPYLDAVEFEHVGDETARMLRVTSGEAEVGTSVPYALLDQYRSRSGVRVQLEPTTGVAFVHPNFGFRPFKDRFVRLAMNYATPREAINRTVFKGTATLANNCVGVLRHWDPSLKPIPYDLDKARELLRQSSSPNGLTAELLVNGQDADSRQMATIIQDSYARIGIKLKIEQVDFITLVTRLGGYDFEMVILPTDALVSDMGAMDAAAIGFWDPLRWNFGGSNYRDPKVQRLLGKALISTDEEERRRLFYELQRYTSYVNPPEIPVVFPVVRTLVSDKVQGLVTLLNSSWRLEDVWLSA